MDPAAFGVVIAHPGPAPDIVAARPATLSARGRLTLGWRACHGPMALAMSVVPAALAFAPEWPWSVRLLLLAAAAVVFVVVRGALRRTVGVATFEKRERDCRRRWQ